ncbi:hypothetical protein GIB67_022642 [Kingdonia uniflora]|uniref:Uncharacterized protein n=1 Tax=Kingdonia uniflora TaxID=39325 RepID=A0A7J7P8H3_9MAGN|nr:hypothetical protein GIB67_022642 [Kingdonia uniflora]
MRGEVYCWDSILGIGFELHINALDCRDDKERKTKFASVIAARILFGALGCLMVGTLIYTLSANDYPFRKELLTP